MEDRGDEWQMKEPKVTWIFDKVTNIGKKIVITGVVISSTPFILPPIFVISAIGLALSIPSGIILSSYLCTRKLMSMFLPINPEREYMYLEAKNEENIGDYVDIDHANVTEDANLESESVVEREFGEELPIEKTKAAESESKRKDDDVARAADTKGTVAGNNDEKDTAIDVVAEEAKAEEMKESESEKKGDDVAREEGQTGKNDDIVVEKTIINDAETNKKLTKKKGKKKNKVSVAHDESEKKMDEEMVAPQTNTEARDTSEIHGSEKVLESEQTAPRATGSRAERRKNMGKT